jgi:hypothetical protein
MLGDQVDEACVVDRRDAVDQARSHAARLHVGGQDIDLQTRQRGADARRVAPAAVAA